MTNKAILTVALALSLSTGFAFAARADEQQTVPVHREQGAIQTASDPSGPPQLPTQDAQSSVQHDPCRSSGTVVVGDTDLRNAPAGWL